MNAAVITGLVGALVGASVSIFTTWLTQRSQLQRELAQRRFGELTRWTRQVAAEDFPALREIRLRLMNAMQAELTPSLVEEVDRPAPVSRQ